MTTINEWPTFLHNLQRTGYVRDTFPPPLRLAWTYELGGYVWSHPVIADHMVYISGPRFVALELETGAVRWRAETERYPSALGATIWRDLLVFCSRDGLYLARRADGRIIHHIATNSINVSPCVDEHCVYWIGDQHLYAATLPDGAPRWQRDIQAWKCLPAIVGDMVYVAGQRAIFALGKETGDMRWHAELPAADGIDTLTLDGERLFASVRSGLYALDQATGALRWHFPDAVHRTPVSIADDHIYVVADGLRALDSTTGAVQWSTEFMRDEQQNQWRLGLSESAPIVIGDHLYIGGGHADQVYGFDRHTGEQVWDYPTGDLVFSTPAYANGRLVIGCHDGFVYCFEHA